VLLQPREPRALDRFLAKVFARRVGRDDLDDDASIVEEPAVAL
jgi:hypothetical protein